jgi:hypothetical protein
MVTEKPKLREGKGQIMLFYTRCQPSNFDVEDEALGLPVDGGHGPGDTNAKEHVDSVGSGHIADRVVSGLVLNSSSLGGKGVWGESGVSGVQVALVSMYLPKLSLFCIYVKIEQTLHVGY